MSVGTQQSTPPATGKRIVLFSDGTGNSSAKLFKTNVWRLYDALDVDPLPAPGTPIDPADPKVTDPVRQIAYYDDGVGTSSFKPYAILGGALGVGLARNVRDIYAFLCRHYQPGDEIYGFGFSRGSFTMRVVAGLIDHQGVITDFADEADLQRKVAAAYREYRKSFDTLSLFNALTVHGMRTVRNWTIRKFEGWKGLPAIKPVRHELPGDRGIRFAPAKTAFPDIEFLGLWDSVDAYGLPLDEMTRAWDQYIWPLSMREYDLPGCVKKARHVLALDDERHTFHPRLWNNHKDDIDSNGKEISDIDKRRITQVWFAGVHSNVGGGYPNDTLSYVSLNWMFERIARAKAGKPCLRFQPMKRALAAESADPLGPIYDSRSGFGGFYRYQPRRMKFLAESEPRSRMKARYKRWTKGSTESLDKVSATKRDIGPQLIHHSVFDRIAAAEKTGYGPLIIEKAYRVIGPDSPGQTSNIIELAQKKGPPRPPHTIESQDEAAVRADLQEQVFNRVWLRRVVYFASVFVAAWIAVLPFKLDIEKTDGFDRTMRSGISLIPEMVAGFVPGLFKPWLDVFATHAWSFLWLVSTLAGLLWLGGHLAGTINAQTALIWRRHDNTTPKVGLANRSLNSRVEKLRNSARYQRLFANYKYTFAPGFFAAIFIIAFASFGTRAWFNFVTEPGIKTVPAYFSDYFAPLCRPAALQKQPFPDKIPLDGKREERSAAGFEISNPCWGSGIFLRGGQRYEITLTGSELDEGWTNLDVFGVSKDQTALQWRPNLLLHLYDNLFLPFRRVFTEPWMTPIIKIGNKGRDAQTLFPKIPPRRPREMRDTFVAEFTARRNGEVFLYLNDGIGPRFLTRWFYNNNRGQITVTVKQLAWDANFSRH